MRLLDFKRATNLGIALKRLKHDPRMLATCLRELTCVLSTAGKDTAIAATSVRSDTESAAASHIDTVHLGVLGVEDLELLVSVIPTQDELATLRQYSGPVENLAEAERFVHALRELPNPMASASALHFQATFGGRLWECWSKMRVIHDAIAGARSSSALR